MNIEQQIAKIEFFLDQPDVYRIEHISKRLDDLFNNLLTEYTPDLEISKAINFTQQWKKDLKGEVEKFTNITQKLIDDSDKFLKEVDNSLKKIDQGVISDNKIPEWKTSVDWKKFEEDSKFNDLIKKLPVAFDLYNFENSAKTETLKFQSNFLFSDLKVDYIKKIFILFGIVVSFYLGIFLENTIDLPPILITIIGSLLCLLTSDKYINAFYERVFFKNTKKMIKDIKDSYINFITLKLIFEELIKEYPEIVK